MKILHSSDWHFGKTIEGRDRMDEFAAFVDEFVALAEEEEVDLVLLPGDLYDVANPSAAAQRLLCEAIDRLAAGGSRGVIVTAGNHDSPDRLVAPLPLATRQGVVILGRPCDEPELDPEGSPRDRVLRVAGGPSWVELRIPGCPHPAVVAALPYASEGRLNEVFIEDIAEEGTAQAAYSKRVGGLYAQLASHFRPDSVNLGMGHLFARGGHPSDSEREIQVGGAYTVYPEDLPAGAHYVALGHLHRPQEVKGAPSPTWYAGSPLVLSTSEIAYAKSVVIVEAEPGEEAVIRHVKVLAGRRIEVPEPCPYAEALALATDREEQDANVWLVLAINDRLSLTATENHELRRACKRLVQIRCVSEAAAAESGAVADRGERSAGELFIDFFQHSKGAAPDEALVQTFVALLDGLDASEVLSRAGQPKESESSCAR
ncbi:MAG: exonuclease subunit SbcD [Planctomycetes bacterium]|nr:exonuclease subunit SbcD [Planctomycetota bacterium]